MMINNLTDKYLQSIIQIQIESYPTESQEQISSLQFHWNSFPDFSLVCLHNHKPSGYLVAHPWPLRVPPPINKERYTLPENSTSLFIHDLALLPQVRGSGLAKKMVEKILSKGVEKGFLSFSLLSVQGTKKFWEKFGFETINELPDFYFNNVKTYYPSSEVYYMEKNI